MSQDRQRRCCRVAQRRAVRLSRRRRAFAIAQHLAVAIVGRLRTTQCRLRARRAPVRYQQPSGILLSPLRAADDQPFGRARHRHVKQPPVFVARLASAASRAAAIGADVVVLRRRPRPSGRRARHRLLRRQRQQSRRMPALRRRRGVGEDDDRRLQPLGAVHGHHAHLVALHLHVALDLGLRRAQPGDEALQRRRLRAFVVEREIEEFVERVGGLMSEPREEFAAALLGAEQPGVERERRRARARARACSSNVAPQVRAAASRKRVAQAALAVPGELEQRVVVEAEQRALEHGRQRQIVLRQQQRCRPAPSGPSPRCAR